MHTFGQRWPHSDSLRPQVTSNKTENAAGFELSCVPVCHNQKSFHSGVVERRAEIHILVGVRVKIEQTLFDLLSFGLIDPNPNILASLAMQGHQKKFIVLLGTNILIYSLFTLMDIITKSVQSALV